MRRREFIAGLVGAAAWPVAARAQQPARMRRIGVMLGTLPADDPEAQTRVTAFVQGLQELGWTDGRNVRDRIPLGFGRRRPPAPIAAELVALAPDVVLVGGNLALAAFQQASGTMPIVFANVADPVGVGQSPVLARPGGNATGFMAFEFGQELEIDRIAQSRSRHM